MLKKLMTMMATVMLAVVAIAAQCTATTRKGTQCRRQASPGSSYCWQHGGTTKAERAAGSLLNDASTRQSENSYQQCKVTTKRGTQCSRRAKAGSSYCWQHYAIADDTRDSSQTMSVQITPQQDASAIQKGDASTTVSGGKCTATTKSGRPCSRKAKPGSSRCWQHTN